MNKFVTLIIAIILVVVVAGIVYLSWFTIADSETELIDESGQEVTISGTVVENIMEVPADGNNALMVDVEIGRIQVLYQEGGLVAPDSVDAQCNNNPLVAEIAQTIQAGDVVEIFGVRRTDAYYMDVCSSADYSITVTQASTEVTLGIIDESPVGSDTGDEEMQATRQVTGEVVELISDCAFDGNCAYVVETESGESVTVIWAEGMSPICQNDPFQGGDTDIQVGDSIDSLGRVIDASTTSACGDPSYYIRKTS